MNKEQDTILEVEGMSCMSCVRHVTSALTAVDGVGNVDVKLKEGLVIVHHDTSRVPIAQLIEALGGAGYASRPRAA
jgi:copper chaperone